MTYLLSPKRRRDLKRFIVAINAAIRTVQGYGFRLDIIDDHLAVFSDDKIPEGHDWVADGEFGEDGLLLVEPSEEVPADA